MRRFLQNKLWRDKMPELMEDAHSKIHVKELSDKEYDASLRDKLLEEAQEVKEASCKENLSEEIADVLEEIDALCKFHNIDKLCIEQTKEKNF